MNDLNEKLAVEVMGAKLIDGMQPLYSASEPVFDGHWHIFASQWNPTTDLNQLKMCYEAAEKEHPIVFWAMYWAELKKLFSNSLIEEDAHCATAWVKHPELVAQAIIKAKGVSL